MNRYARQILFGPVGEEGQKRLAAARVTLVGVGALGSALADLLARAGTGFLRICDRDLVEWGNLSRQTLYDEDDARAGLPKAAAAARRLARVNSEVKTDPRVCDVNASNVEDLVRDADLVLDGTDNFETRARVNDACVKLGKPWVYGGCVGSRGMAMAVLPGEGPCFTCLLGEVPAPGTFPTCDTAGVLNTAVGVTASLQATEALKILTGCRGAQAGGLRTFDLWTDSFRLLQVPRSSSCETCVGRRFPHLEPGGSGAAAICGRDAVQVTPARESRLDLAEAERRLAPLGPVRRNDYLLKVAVEGCELTLFPDARAIVRGTSDTARARSLYAKYVGM